MVEIFYVSPKCITGPPNIYLQKPKIAYNELLDKAIVILNFYFHLTPIILIFFSIIPIMAFLVYQFQNVYVNYQFIQYHYFSTFRSSSQATFVAKAPKAIECLQWSSWLNSKSSKIHSRRVLLIRFFPKTSI